MFSVLHPVNPTSRLCVYLEQDAIPQGKSVFSLVASCQQDRRASTALGRGDKGGSEVQIAGFQHCELMSNMPFLGEGLMQVTTKEGEGIESKDRAETRDWEGEDKAQECPCGCVSAGDSGRAPSSCAACSNHCRKEPVSVVPAST